MRLSRTLPLAVTAVALAAPGAVAAAAPARTGPQRHVLLVSVDGLHQDDLTRWVRLHPHGALARLVSGGREFTAAQTPFPSDSFPGLVGQLTGGDPRTTGVYYDVTWNPTLLAPGTKSCTGATPGTTVAYDESIDKDPSRLDAGQGVATAPGGILAMTGAPRALIDPTKLPVDPTTCKPVYPDQYLKVNTVFSVARAHGLRTAWSDKHPAYEILGGPGGKAIQDLFTPEINSDDAATKGDWTTDNAATQQYDAAKVQAVVNELDGYDHSRKGRLGVPAVLGLNFQAVSTAEKLPVSGGEAGGYTADGKRFGPVLTSALTFVDAQVGRLEQEISRQHLGASTTVILSAKHGQSPEDMGSLTRIDDGAVLDALNAAWRKAADVDPTASHTTDLVAGSSDDDGMLLWLSDRSAAATRFAASFLLSVNGNGTGADGAAKATDSAGKPRPYAASGLTSVLSGAGAAEFFGVRPGDARVPDVVGLAQHGVVFTGGTKKIAEHGGFDPQDRDVPLVVSGGGVARGVVGTSVETTQIAPTILGLLGIDPRELQAVRIQGTAVLPGAVG
ncbi:type I phosphodiesterase/nucleotide pyrophosphatase [Motilibacter rhizosphaerae]|uniref:Type I phosphodiesterase/nucleotide pyrophosphatase n=1 Tax=Motilibacter rhizosphaerae TaxID=598652 RepID=A0A4V2F498_9ACTN|nr:alkaline phosphatase family protein [Motilibacter rhizosphaerae]RZS86857.1 type I phosphodiesterase/nucleotide pyrophosphatase [Motilibacter rhizosphaerae]